MSAPTHAGIRGPGSSEGRSRRHWKAPAVALTVLGLAAQGGLAAMPAGATLSGAGVSAGKNITVFHNIDMVAVFGYGSVGEQITVQVFRPGIANPIGTARGPAVLTDEGPGLEVNHGVDGTAQPGDCWIGTTPDIQPKDRIVVTSGSLENEVTVDDIRFSGPPKTEGTDVIVSGVAKRANGTAIAALDLDSAEFRDETGKYRATPNAIEATDANGGFNMRYRPPFTGDRNRDGLTEAQRKQALLGNGHAIGFGHTDPLPRESMLVDGIKDEPGPAAGCGGTAPEPDEPPIFTPDPTPQPADTVKPTLTSRSPKAGATGVSRSANVTAKFSEAVSGISGGTFVLKRNGSTTAIQAQVSYSASTRTAKLDPNSRLRSNTRYTVTLTSGVKDLAGNTFAGTSWGFRTRS